MANVSKKGWKLSEAQALIAAMQAKASKFGYTITLGGSVLTKGESNNDLDIFIVPNQWVGSQYPVDMLMWLASKFGAGRTVVPTYTPGQQAPPPPRQQAGGKPLVSKYEHSMSFTLDGRKIEVHVL